MEKQQLKKTVKSSISSFLTFFAVLIYFKIFNSESSFNFLLLLLFLGLLYFYHKINIKSEKRINKYSIIISIILSLMLSIGNIVNSYIYEPVTNIFNLKNILYVLICTIGFFLFFYKCFVIFLPKVKSISIIEKHDKISRKKSILIFLVMLFGYSLYFIRYYPALMTPDSYYVLHYANNFILSDFHTFGHTWFFGVFFHLGKILFNNMNTAVAFATIIQMICVSLIFTYAISFMYNKGLNKKICTILVLIYAFNPLHGHYSITLWRDILFGCSFVILLISLYGFITNNENKKTDIILFIIGTLIMLFFRNNGIYIYIFIMPFIIIILKNKRLLMSILTASILVFYMIIKGPIFDYFNIEKTTSVEAFSIPLQQMARVVASGRQVEGKNREYLENLFDYNEISTKYYPVISDNVKRITDNNYLTDNKMAFVKTYLSLFSKYPNIYIEAYLLQTLGYWYPDVIYWATAYPGTPMFDTEMVYTDSLMPQWYSEVIAITTSRKLPLNNLIWSIGLHFIILLISSLLICYLKKYRYLLCLVPLYGLWISIMLATPVFCELRYVYGLFTCSPLLVILPFIINKEEKND